MQVCVHAATHTWLSCSLSIHNYNMDSVLWATSPLCYIMICSNESPSCNPLQHCPGNKASDRPAGDEAFLWPVSIPGGYVFVCVCMCVRACCCSSIQPDTEAHCLVFTAVQHILPSLLPRSSAHTLHCAGEESVLFTRTVQLCHQPSRK